MRQTASAEAVAVFRTTQDRLELWAKTNEDLAIMKKEMAVAEWVLAHG